MDRRMPDEKNARLQKVVDYQLEVLNWAKDFEAKNGRPPSYTENTDKAQELMRRAIADANDMGSSLVAPSLQKGGQKPAPQPQQKSGAQQSNRPPAPPGQPSAPGGPLLVPPAAMNPGFPYRKMPIWRTWNQFMDAVDEGLTNTDANGNVTKGALYDIAKRQGIHVDDLLAAQFAIMKPNPQHPTKR